MPYIKANARKRAKLKPNDVGELNYVLSDIIDDYIIDRCGTKLSYEVLNGVAGVLACMQMEIYRRITAPYEETKRQENGDVFYSAGLLK